VLATDDTAVHQATAALAEVSSATEECRWIAIEKCRSMAVS
jgi:hypothetical protein